MKQENKDRLLKMIKMRLDGCTFQAIADEFGVTRQYVQQTIADATGKVRAVRKSPLDSCIYPNLKKWMIDNGISLIRLSIMCGSCKTRSDVIKKKITGESDFKISEIKEILKESGETFEYMFSIEGEKDEIKKN